MRLHRLVEPHVRRRFLVRGIVQGVGFRPFVFHLANRHGLTGLVGNDSAGVFIEVQGPVEKVDAFRAGLISSPPPLAHLESVAVEALQPRSESAFVIVHSEAKAGAGTPISPDVATCDACLAELFSPTDRRYRYPFINCTNCGPRYTIIRDIPYDRPATTMAGFPLCPACQKEYDDPLDRRFHAQPNACPVCGPTLAWLHPVTGDRASGEDALQRARAALTEGAIVAIKGIGGFHLACDATRDDAVVRLRQRKGRIDKPFALMVADLDQARRWVHVEGAANLLQCRERPIVLVRRRIAPDGPLLSPAVAPGNDHLGIFLPYSPLHHLLMGDVPLVMTSGNRGDEPIVRENDEALDRLGPLADAFLLHDRPIHVVCDDSVVRVLEGREYPIRRSRGYAPLPLALPREGPSVLAVGGELKATFCLTRDAHAFLGPHIGDMGNLETLRAFEHAVAHFQALFRTRPERIAADQHPDYLSTRWAEGYAREHGVPLCRVQHHHAHVASLMAEHGLTGDDPILGVCFDGTGLGSDGAIWGGEILLADFAGFERLAHLRYVPLPGGDASIRRPYRTALAHLWAAGIPWADDLAPVAACPPGERRVLSRQLQTGTRCVPTSSMGRLFDAVAALLGIRQVVTYEAQAAIEMEALATECDEGYPFDLISGEPLQADPGPLFHAIVADLRQGTPPAVIAARFHAAVARLIVRLALAARERTGREVVGLTGGVFQNVRLVQIARDLLRREGFAVLMHHHAPANDGGLALGQAAVARVGTVTIPGKE